MEAAREALFAEKKAQEGGLEEEGEDAFHRKGMPMTPPVRRENSLQLVPNWNSIGMPVTTPRRKLMAKIFRPEASGDIVLCTLVLINCAESDRLENDDQER